SWKTCKGPIMHSAILGGEDFDARRNPVGWNKPGYDDREWLNVVETEGPGGMLISNSGLSMKVYQEFRPRSIDEPQPGIFVYDFGQNASAVPRIRIHGRAGQAIRLFPAEQRHGMSPRRNDGRGLVNPAGVGSPNYWQYTLGTETEETWTPQF